MSTTPPGPPPYGTPQHYGAVPAASGPPPGATTSGMATASLVLGLLGFLSCGLASIGAVICGHIGLAQTRDRQLIGRDQAIWGLILGYLVLVPALMVLGLLVVGVISFRMFAMGSSG